MSPARLGTKSLKPQSGCSRESPPRRPVVLARRRPSFTPVVGRHRVGVREHTVASTMQPVWMQLLPIAGLIAIAAIAAYLTQVLVLD